MWWFSVVDIIQVLTQQTDYQTARKYWNKLKERLGKEDSQLVTNCHRLKGSRTMQIKSAFFEAQEIRRIYDEKTEIWWFSVIDIIQVLTQQTDYQTARKYWNKLKERLGKEDSQLVTTCHQLKMTAEDGSKASTPSELPY